MGDAGRIPARLAALYDDLIGAEGSAKERRRRRILEAATERFMASGYRKTSVDEIARGAGVAKGTIYLHFRTKADLLMAAIAVEERALMTRALVILDGEGEEERLRSLVRLFLTVSREMPLMASLMRGENEMIIALEEVDPSIRASWEAVGVEWLAGLIDDASPYEFSLAERRERANTVLALSFFAGLLEDETIRGGRSLDGFADTMADVVVYGLLNRAPGPESRTESSQEDEEADEE